MTGGTTATLGTAFRAGGVYGTLQAARGLGLTRSALSLGYAGYAITGDAFGLVQSGQAAYHGTLTPLDLLGFAPSVGFAGAGLRAGELFTEFPTTNPFNYRLDIRVSTLFTPGRNIPLRYLGQVQFPVGRSGYRNHDEFADAVFTRYQQYVDDAFARYKPLVNKANFLHRTRLRL